MKGSFIEKLVSFHVCTRRSAPKGKKTKVVFLFSCSRWNEKKTERDGSATRRKMSRHVILLSSLSPAVKVADNVHQLYTLSSVYIVPTVFLDYVQRSFSIFWI